MEQFLGSCSLIELQELDLHLGRYLRKARMDHVKKAYVKGIDPEEYCDDDLGPSKEIGFDQSF